MLPCCLYLIENKKQRETERMRQKEGAQGISQNQKFQNTTGKKIYIECLYPSIAMVIHATGNSELQHPRALG